MHSSSSSSPRLPVVRLRVTSSFIQPSFTLLCHTLDSIHISHLAFFQRSLSVAKVIFAVVCAMQCRVFTVKCRNTVTRYSCRLVFCSQPIYTGSKQWMAKRRASYARILKTTPPTQLSRPCVVSVQRNTGDYLSPAIPPKSLLSLPWHRPTHAHASRRSRKLTQPRS